MDRCPNCGYGLRPVLRAGEAAKMLQVSRRTINEWVRLGVLPSMQKPGTGNHARIPRAAVEAVLEKMEADCS